MQMQAIKQNSEENMQCKRHAKESESWCGKRCNEGDMQKKTKIGAENDAMQAICKRKQKRMWKTMQCRRYAKENESKCRKRCNAGDMQKKTKAGATKPNLHA